MFKIRQTLLLIIVLFTAAAYMLVSQNSAHAGSPAKAAATYPVHVKGKAITGCQAWERENIRRIHGVSKDYYQCRWMLSWQAVGKGGKWQRRCSWKNGRGRDKGHPRWGYWVRYTGKSCSTRYAGA